MSQAPAEYLAGDEGVVRCHWRKTGVSRLSIANAPDLLLIPVAAAKANAAGALQFINCFANGGNGAARQGRQSLKTDRALAKTIAAAVQGGSYASRVVGKCVIE